MRAPTLLVFAVLAAPNSAQQSVLYLLEGDSPGDALGAAAVAVHDLDGDGVRDLALGAPGDELRRVRLHSGADGAFLFSLAGTAAADGFGSSLADVGDVDGDGLAELAVAAPAGAYVRLVSLPTGATLWTWSGAVTQVSRAGDVDGDGVPDVLALRSGGGSSALAVLSGATGVAGLTLAFPTEEWRFVDGGGDADGDGRADVLLGNPFWPTGAWPGLYSGRVRVYSGASGALLHDEFGTGPFDDSLGWGVSWLDDLDGDARAEFAAGQPNDIWLDDDGRVRLYSGATGAIHGELVFPAVSGLGAGIADAGDLDGDGLRDLLVARGPFASQVRGYSSATLQPLFTFDLGPASLDFPAPVIGVLDDVDQDGDVEIFSAHATGTEAGQALVLGLCEPPVQFCVAAANSASAAGAQIGWKGSTSVAANQFALTAVLVPGGMPGLFLYSAGQAQVPFGNGWLCLGGTASVMRILPLVANPSQAAQGLPLDFTAPPFAAGQGAITPGSTWHFQYWYRDTLAPPTFFNLSGGLSVTFCP
jgi:hypothetical protein